MAKKEDWSFPKFKLGDFVQVVVGATILAVPVSFTQEVWDLGTVLPMANILTIMFFSVLFIALFTYYHYHGRIMHQSLHAFMSRVFVTYGATFFVVAIVLALIGQADWTSGSIVAFKRTVLVALPASMSAAVVDKL